MTFLLRNKGAAKSVVNTSLPTGNSIGNTTQVSQGGSNTNTVAPTQPSRIIPTPQDLYNDKILEQFEAEYKLSDSPESAALRMRVLGKLNAIIQGWVQEEVKKQNIPDHEAKTYRAEVISFGSFRLGVNNEGGDIDMLCVCPYIISREAFFTNLRPKIEFSPDCRDFKSAPQTYVPLMSFMFCDVEIDLVFARVPLPKLPTPFVVSNIQNITDTGPKDVLSLTGARVTDKILQLAPYARSFRSTLRFLKLWSKRRGVGSNVMGYLGGVSWAILTVLACQRFPTESGSIVLQKFFELLSTWEWPQAVNLVPTDTGSAYAHLHHHFDPIWTPESNPNDIFPILTPVFPCKNSTYNVRHVTKRILISELQRGAEITARLKNIQNLDKNGDSFADQIDRISDDLEKNDRKVVENDNNSNTHSNSNDPNKINETIMREVLLELIKDPGFFSSYQHYFDIVITTTTHLEMTTWFNFAESKVRLFFDKVFDTNKARTSVNPPLTLHPWPHSSTDPTEGIFERHFYIGVKFHIPPTQMKDLDFQTAFALFTEKTNEFPEKTSNMSAKVKHIKNWQLPDWVFPNSIRPDNVPNGPPIKRVLPVGDVGKRREPPNLQDASDQHVGGNKENNSNPTNQFANVIGNNNPIVQLNNGSNPSNG
jgi:poly(A) polymerase Pap1